MNDITNIKLIDFGLSKDATQMPIKSLCSGSPYYVAPEVINNELSIACDIWSLGVVMYVCLLGKLPFPGCSTGEVFKNVQTHIIFEKGKCVDADLIQNVSE